MLEYNLYRAVGLARGDVTTFFTRPISATLLAIAALMTVGVMFKTVRMKRALIEEEDDD